jgi:hypothetical protein
MARNPDLNIASVLAVTKRTPGRGRGRKSELYRWMAARHDALAAGFAKDPPSWTGLAKFFTDAGMLSTDGLPQTAASVRSTWIRVTQAAARKKAVSGAGSSVEAPTRTDDPDLTAALDLPQQDPSPPLSARDRLRAKMKPVT